MKIVAVAMDKGGVGKTTLTLNLAAGLARRGKRILLVDADPQASITENLLPALAADSGGVVDYFVAPLREEGIAPVELLRVLPQPIEIASLGLWLLPATPRLREVEFRRDEGIYWRLAQSLRAIGDRFDVCLIDNRGALGPLTICALVAAESALIPIEADVLSVQKLPPLLRTVEIVRTRYGNPSLRVLGIVLNRVDMRTTLAREVTESLRQNFNGAVFDTRIPENVRIREAIGHAKAIFDYDADEKVGAGRGSLAYQALVDEFIRRLENVAVE